MADGDDAKKKRGILPLVQTGNLIFLSGHGCEGDDGKPIAAGHVGGDLSVEDGVRAARKCGERLLNTLEEYLGSLDRVKRIIKVLGFVNSAPGFYEQPRVMNGFSELMVARLGDRGRHARSAIGTSVLPANQAVEIEMVVEVEETV